MPAEVSMEEEPKKAGDVSEGPFLGGMAEQDRLERDLEKEVVMQLHEENMWLKQKLKEMEEREKDVWIWLE